ncbi:MAG: NHLP leader peptide family RiPP precursor [Haliscomenobacter sp.]|nr:NHLP leader peptide family RiPP precursor [Haliscomenobacter sp.]MBK7477378.1 NHLP leader peptide family RiPP precursor [Haliscomenobacter sp.]MBK8880105.1 NHLP leader peptide family RiPP precursor [Haliscomenobacter sp.]
METTQEQKLNAQVIQKAWEDAQFMSDLKANPVAAMEKLTGHKIGLPEGQKLVVVDQSDDSTVYFNIPRKINVDSMQLTEEELELVAGGITPTFIALGYGFMAGVAVWAAAHQ